MEVTSLQDLMLDKLRMMYDAEQAGLAAMPRLAEQLSRDEVRQAFETHRVQTEAQVRRLEQVFEQMGQRPERRESVVTRALAQEAEQVLVGIRDPSTRDAFIIAAQQAVEHHEIASYGTARTWAQQLGMTEVAALLEETLREEEETDQLLSDIAERMVNQEAAEGSATRGDREVPLEAAAGDRMPAGESRGGGSARKIGGMDDVREVGG